MIDIVMLKNRVMRELGISQVSAQSQYEALDELGDRIMQAVLVSTYEAVPENLRTEFMRLTDMG
ncbi:hypothetical protein KW798_03555, partial [Candidatus Parcubacteria bacterium]|nr:hypothetical protein [Candidatus Parcubacteria bacterium]